MDVLKQFKDSASSKSYSAELRAEKYLNRKAVISIFVISTIFYIVDILVSNYCLEVKKLSTPIVIVTLSLLFARAIGFYIYLRYEHKFEALWFQVYEYIFAILFAGTAIVVWNAELTMDMRRAYIIGLDAGWMLRYILLLFPHWKFKAIIDFSVVLFGVIRLAVVSQSFSFAYIQALCQIFFVFILLYSKEKSQKFHFKRAFSLQRNEQTLKAILDNIPENIAVLDLDGDLIYYNEYLDICFDISRQKDDEIDIFAHFYNIKPRERYFTFDSVNESDSPGKETNPKILRKTPIRKNTLKFAAKSFPQNQHLMEENEFRKKKETNLNFVNFDKDDQIKSNRSKNLRDSHTSLTEAISSVERFNSLQNVINFFITNLANLRNYSSKLNNFFIFDCKYRAPDDTHIRSFEIKISLANFDEKESLILILRDTTHRDIIANLESNNTFKDSVLASMSHELRTPLNTNINMLSIALNDFNIPESLKEAYLVPAHQAGKLLKCSINDVLDYSLLLARKLQTQNKSKLLFNTIQKIKYLIESQAKMKGLEFKVVIKNGVNSTIQTDHKRLQQILVNLLSNSLKFTIKGEIVLTVEPWGLEQRVLKFSVSDTGIGIPEKVVDRIRQILRKNEFTEKISESSAGVGIGLMMAHLLSKKLGPKISKLSGLKLESQFQEGSTFWFFIDTKHETPVPSSPISVHIEGNINSQHESTNQIRGNIFSQAMSEQKDEELNTLNTESNHSQVKLIETKYKLTRLSTIERRREETFEISINGQEREATLGDEDVIEDEIACMVKDSNMKLNTEGDNSFVDMRRFSRPKLLTDTVKQNKTPEMIRWNSNLSTNYFIFFL